MKRSFRTFGGDRPVFTEQPIMVTGGFSLNATQAAAFPVGSVIPVGTMSHIDEVSREITIINSARVVAIDANDAKIVTLQTYDTSAPVLVVESVVAKDLGATLASSPKITEVKKVDAGLQITLSKAISGLSVGDALFEVVADGTNVKLLATPNSITIADAEVKEDGDTPIDVTRNTCYGEAYARRLPPVPATLLEGNILKGTKVAYTNSL